MEPKAPGLLDAFEHEGRWWVPSRPSDRVAGTLSYDLTDGLHLDWLGHISPVSQVWASRQAEIEVIYGETKTGQPTTLHRSFSKSFHVRFEGISTERLRSRTALIGAHIDQPETRTFRSCAFRFSNLEEWLSAQPLSVKNVTLPPQRAFDVAYRPPPETAYALDHLGAQLKTASSYETQDETPRHFGITARSWLVLEPDSPRTLTWYRDAAAKLRNLIALCFGAPIYVEGITLLGPDPPGSGASELMFFTSRAPRRPRGLRTRHAAG